MRTDLPRGTNPSAVVVTLITLGIMFFAAAEAANLLGFEQVAALISEFLIFFDNVILGLVVLGLGMYLANLADRTIRTSDMQNSGILATAARYSIILLTLAMALLPDGDCGRYCDADVWVGWASNCTSGIAPCGR
jgi:hypothetical protein